MVQNAGMPSRFLALIRLVTSRLAGRPIEPSLGGYLTGEFPANGAWFEEMQQLCLRGCSEGWLCASERGGIKFGRVVKPGAEAAGFSVDVVDMKDVVGPHHRHPHGEVDLIMPLDEGAEFDGTGKGWKVYGPGSAHRPTVTGGRALILYLLPEGAIEFTRE